MRPHRPPPFMMMAPVGAALALAGAGAAQAGTCAPCSPPPPPPAPCGCAPTSHQVKVPGVNITPPQVNIGLPSIGVGIGSASGVANANASAGASSDVSVSVSTSGSSSAQTAAGLFGSFGGGGSGSWSPEAGVTTEISDVKVETIQVPPPPVFQQICAAWKAAVRQVAVQATCLDDKAVPHPASQVFPDRAVVPGYEGEVFRCIAGARMQYTIADFSGQADFNHGQTIVCQKGEALYHSAAGALQCRAQAPARDCNERSLLRRFGAGIKVLAVNGQQVCTAYRSQQVAVGQGLPLPPAPPIGPAVLN
jgi:hypothetical protein